jgi:hypothetical protein
METHINYLVNSKDFVATRIALTQAKLAITELIAVYKIYNRNVNLDSLTKQAEDIDALLNNLNYTKAKVSR